MTAPVYELSNLCYPAKGTPILADATLAIPGESFTAILGANGAGKSTLLRLLAGHAPDYSGSIQMFGEPLNGRGGSATCHNSTSLRSPCQSGKWC